MTTEEKAKAYDKALENAKRLYEQGTITESLAHIFPELKEGEDEKIKEAIIRILKGEAGYTSKEDADRYVAWLEKQESNLVKNGYTNNKDFIRYADNYSHEIWHKLMDNFKNIKDYHIGCNDVSDIVLNAIIDTCNWLEKQGENTLIEEIKRRKELYSREKEKAVLFAEKLSLGDRIAVLEELLVFANEKQGQQKPILDFKASNWYVSKVDGKIHDLTYNPTDKTEPTFKVGDWIVTDKNSVVRIKSIDSNYYVLENTMRFTIDYVDKCWHLWTIQDAKEGDVLAVERDKTPFIFKEFDKFHPGCPVAYCGIDDSGIFVNSGDGWWTDEEVYPATKEQCDLLFQKIKEAGYEWDAVSKKLKKVEQKPSWSEDDECIYQSIIDDTVQENQLDSKQIDWLKSLKDRVQPQPKIEWSEEDEDNLRFSERHFKTFLTNSYYDTFRNWLKSVKERLGGK